MKKYLEPTPLLDFDTPAIRDLILARGWNSIADDKGKIRAAYDFVRNDVRFGYNASDDIPASRVLADGYGQCNTKTTLLMALLRALEIPCRFHGATIDKALQRGAVTGLWYYLAPVEIIHSWAEIWFNGTWVKLEGVILDSDYLSAVQREVSKTAESGTGFTGYAIATKNITAPDVEWKGRDTAIQQEGVTNDLGVYDAPDTFYAKYGANMTPLKRILFARIVRHRLNVRIEQIRKGNVTFDPAPCMQ
ncbi:transglutaminase family protein [Herbaspirillum sp. HC18]|nr:transglutaminase family protein [Herbaspirillum sp. HC18]